jgi:hypothetical protein
VKFLRQAAGYTRLDCELNVDIGKELNKVTWTYKRTPPNLMDLLSRLPDAKTNPRI